MPYGPKPPRPLDQLALALALEIAPGAGMGWLGGSLMGLFSPGVIGSTIGGTRSGAGGGGGAIGGSGGTIWAHCFRQLLK
jgi:hypothetical protein